MDGSAWLAVNGASHGQTEEELQQHHLGHCREGDSGGKARAAAHRKSLSQNGRIGFRVEVKGSASGFHGFNIQPVGRPLSRDQGLKSLGVEDPFLCSL